MADKPEQQPGEATVPAARSATMSENGLEMRIAELLEELSTGGLLGPHRAALDPPLGSGARPWAKHLRRMDIEGVAENLHLGVCYLRLRGLTSTHAEQEALRTPEDGVPPLSWTGYRLES